MIKFEHGMLVLNSLMTKEDVAAINEFADYVRNQENERIIKQLREKAVDLMRISESIYEDEYMNAGDGDAPYWGSFALNDFADALIKGENK